MPARRCVFAEDPDEEEDREGGERREDERRARRDADGERAEVDVRADPNSPEEGDDAVVDGRRAGHVGHVRDSNQGVARSFHKLQALLWKCG
jgi:hypothetical protein